MKRFVALATALLCLLLPATAFAYNPLTDACAAGGGGAQSTACSASGGSPQNPVSGQNGVLEKATLIIATISGIAAVITIIIAGLTYVTAGGNAQRAETARNAIIGSVVGLVIIAAAASIVTYVVSKV